MRLLLVEDEPSIAVPLAGALRKEGFEVEVVATGQAALEAPLPDLVLLDLRLPDIDGFEVCRRLRTRSDVPVIMLTARGEEMDRVVGLEIGADDYLVKPFSARELIARIRAVTRRTSERATPGGELHVVGRLAVDPRGRRVTLADQEIALTPKEYELLALLASEPGAAIGRERILEEVWKAQWYGHAKTIDVHVGALRRKLGDPRWIETIRTVGFRLQDPA